MYIFYSRVKASFSFWGEISFWDKLGFVFVANYLAVTVIGTIMALSFSSRTWCRFCPMGTFQLLMYKLGKMLKMNRKTDQKVVIKEIEACIRCSTCIENCPLKLLEKDIA